MCRSRYYHFFSSVVEVGFVEVLKIWLQDYNRVKVHRFHYNYSRVALSLSVVSFGMGFVFLSGLHVSL